LFTDPTSPTKQRLDVIQSELTRLGKLPQSQAVKDQIAELEGEKEVHQFRQITTDLNRIDPVIIRDMLKDGIAKEYTKQFIYRGFNIYGFVVIADPIGDRVKYLILQPYRLENGSHRVTLGRRSASKDAEWYQVVKILDFPFANQTPDEVRAKLLSDDSVNRNVEGVVDDLATNKAIAGYKAIEFGIKLLPVVGALDEFVQGNYVEAGIQLAGDAAMLVGWGAAIKARNCVYAGSKLIKFAKIGSTAVEGGVAITRLGQGFHALGKGDKADALGYFGDAILRLFGLSAKAVAYLRKPKCFVKGTPVHTEHGLRPIEHIKAGDKVWAFDREATTWRLCSVLQTFERCSDKLTTIELSDGDSVTGTDGHPFWVIEGEALAERPGGDHGQRESAGRVPGRWVGMHGLHTHDRLLARHDRTVPVAKVWTRAEAVPVYNLEVAGLHNYAVGQAGVLVHNADGYVLPVANAAREVPHTTGNPQATKPGANLNPEVTKPTKGKVTAEKAPKTGTPKPDETAALRDPPLDRRPRSNNDPRITSKSELDPKFNDGKVKQVEFGKDDYTKEFQDALSNYDNTLKAGDKTKASRDAGQKIGDIGADQYMKNHQKGSLVYQQTALGGQNDFDRVYKTGDRLAVIEGKGKKATTTSRIIPGETRPNGDPAYAIQGSNKYLQLTANEMLLNGSDAQKAIAKDILDALKNGKLDYYQVATKPRPNGTAYFSVKKYNLSGN
jgi:hypothetical protein